MIKPNGLNPFRRFCITIGELPSSYMESMTYYEMLEWFCKYLEKTVIPAVNNNAEAITELQNLFVELKSYVDNYFTNLDVQEEINNKLDDMATSGELTEIITSYLEMQSILAFDTVEDMKEATNLINGSFVKTYGFYEINDGGGSLYKVRTATESDIVDEMTIIELSDNLIGELIVEDCLNLKQLGCIGNNENDESNILLTGINYANSKNVKLIIPEGTFKCDTQLSISLNNQTIIGSDGSIINAEGCSNVFLTIYNSDNIKLKNLKFISKNGASVKFEDSSNVDIYNCYFELKYNENLNATALGIYRTTESLIQECNNFTIENSTIKSSFLGILFQGKTSKYLKNIYVNNCEFIGTTPNISDSGELLKIDYYSDNTIISNNTFTNPYLSAITCEENSNNITIKNNIILGDIETSKNGIRTYYGQQQLTSENLTIDNNLIKDCQTGILNEYYDNVKIINNTILGSSLYSLQLRNATNRIVENNFSDNKGYLVRDGSIINNNYISCELDEDKAIELNTANGAIITNNKIEKGYISSNRGSNLTIKNNILLNQTRETGAIVLFSSDSTVRYNFKITDNIIEGSDLNYGIYIISHQDSIIVKDNIYINVNGLTYFSGDVTNIENQDGRRVVTYGTTYPSTGSHSKNDIVYNSNPTPGSYVGWICVTTGSPGTWKGFGLIES